MRLNPFAFPSDTTFRFLLFIAALVGVGLLLFDWIYGAFSDHAAEAGALLACTQLNAAPGEVPTGAQVDAFNACIATVDTPRREAVVLGMVLLLVGGLVAYAVAMWRLGRRYAPFTGEDAAPFQASIEALATELGVTRAPRLRWRPLDRRAVGLAFGPPGGRELAFAGGLIPLSIRDRPAFRSIVLHELAHLRNGDVDLSYYAIGIWRALLVVAVAPFLLTLLKILASDPATVASFGWRFLVLLPLAYVIRSGILRAREHDADVRASTREPEIRRVLAAVREPPLSPVRRLIAWHPPASRRVAVIDDPSPLLRLGPLDAFGVGMVGSLAFEQVSQFIGYFGVDAIAVRTLASLAFGPLVGIIVALGTWRQTFAFLATGRGPVRIAGLGLSLVAGLLVGQRVSLSTAYSDDSVLLRPDPAPFHIVITILIAIGAVLFMAWLVATSRMWLPVATRLRSPSWASVPVVVGAAVLLTIAIAVFEIVVSIREVVELLLALPSDLYQSIVAVVPGAGPEWLWRLTMSPEARQVVDQPLIVVFFVVLVLVPWTATAFSAGIADRPVASWGSLDGAAPSIERPELRPRWAIGVGLLAGLGIAAAFVILNVALHARFDPATRDLDAFLYGYAFWLTCATLLGQLVAGGVAAAGAPRFGTLHGALAGLVAGSPASSSPASRRLPRAACPRCPWSWGGRAASRR